MQTLETLSSGRIAQTLQRLFIEAERADRAVMAQFEGVDLSSPEGDALMAGYLDEERHNVGGFYRQFADNFLNVAAEYGRFLYQCARMRKATQIVEFGTSMGISTIYLAAAVRDMGGGKVIGTEIEPGKAARAQAHLEEAGLADLVEIRVGDARQTLATLDHAVDMVLLDGAFSLYLPVLKLLEPRLRSGAPVLAENAFENGNEYLAYVRDPSNGYLSQPIPVSPGRGNEMSVFIR